MTAVALPPLERYCLASLVELAGEHDEGVICSDVVSRLRWTYGRTHEHGTVAKRLSNLHAAGLVRRVGVRRSELTRHGQSVYVPTAKGRRVARTESKAVS